MVKNLDLIINNDRHDISTHEDATKDNFSSLKFSLPLRKSSMYKLLRKLPKVEEASLLVTCKVRVPGDDYTFE